MVCLQNFKNYPEPYCKTEKKIEAMEADGNIFDVSFLRKESLFELKKKKLAKITEKTSAVSKKMKENFRMQSSS